MNYFIKTPKILHSLYKDAVWVLPNSQKEIYLTFDDGPIKVITEKCLDILKEHDVKATFFCVGANAEKNPIILDRILQDGHVVGNHSFNHLKGWSTDNEAYFENVRKCDNLIQSKLFRPPYGKAKRSQLKVLKENYKIIMWDVLSGDFDPNNSAEKIVKNTVDNTESGSIIVMHDNENCGDKMLISLPQIIVKLKEKGFLFRTIQ